MATLDTRQRQEYDHLKRFGNDDDWIYKQLGVENPNAPKLSDVLKPAVTPVTATPPPAAPAPAPVLDPTPAPRQATPALSSIQGAQTPVESLSYQEAQATGRLQDWNKYQQGMRAFSSGGFGAFVENQAAGAGVTPGPRSEER